MKLFNRILTLLAAASLFAAGCVNEDPAYKNQPEVPPVDPNAKGFLTAEGLTMRIILDGQTDTQPDDTSGDTGRPKSSSATRTAEAADSYIVEILDAQNASILKTTYGELKTQLAEPMALAVGTYTLIIRSEENTPAVTWEHPVYSGKKTFSIEKDKTTEIGEVVCTLANIKVTLACSVDLSSNLSEATTSTVSLGDTKITFVKGEKRAAYFMPAAETNTLDFNLSGRFVDPDKPVQFNKTITGVKAGQWRKITLVITYADKGDIKFDIKVENFIQDEEVEVSDGTNGWSEEIYDDSTPPAMTWPGHDLSKSFQLKSTMFNDKGECIEPFTFQLDAPNGIRSLWVTITSTNEAFLAALAVGHVEQTFDLCQITPENPAYVMLSTLGFPLGEEITGKQASSFNLAPAMPLLYNRPGYNGTHTFSFRMIDEKNLTSESALTLVVDPDHEWEAPTIVWKGQDIDKAYTIYSKQTPEQKDEITAIDIEVAAGAGIRSLVVTIDSDKLDVSDVGLPQTFDLCNIEDTKVAKVLSNFGFPVNEKIKNLSSANFSITGFIGLLKGFPGKNNFILDVTDNVDLKTTKTIQLIVVKN